MICFVASVGSKNHLLGWLKFFDSQSKACIQWFLKLTLATKWSTPCERYGKLCQKMMPFLAYHFVWGSLGFLQDVCSLCLALRIETAAYEMVSVSWVEQYGQGFKVFLIWRRRFLLCNPKADAICICNLICCKEGPRNHESRSFSVSDVSSLVSRPHVWGRDKTGAPQCFQCSQEAADELENILHLEP